MKTFQKTLMIFLLFTTIQSSLFAGGVVYLVLGSDTAIWNGINTARHNNFYNIDLYVNPERNTYKVMDPAFRARFVDSYGTTLKMTWWMMAGNIFRYATNTNVPVPNIMTLYLMKKYHGNEVIQNGDELTLHYHTFYWSDYNGDGQYWWNQAKTFLESKDDFDFTLAQFLLEEKVFPVTFRSGWHYMDNDWQHYLDDKILPYSLHNDYPNKKTFDEEPIDNIYDWSEAPSAWLPYNPSYDNYQKPGNGKGWQVRSAHFWKVRYKDYMDSVFAAASTGKDQVACFWGHLPEKDFLDNIATMDSIAHRMEAKYPGVTFRYCTAVEAMQRWRMGNDTIPPVLTLSEKANGTKVAFTINSDEPLFQSVPFVAVKDIYNNYRVAELKKTGEASWETNESFNKDELVKVGVTACDTLGNQTMKFINYLPDDVYIDNSDAGYTELEGNWSSLQKASWGTDARVAAAVKNNPVSAKWEYKIAQTHFYNLFVQIPVLDNPADSVKYVLYQNATPIDTVTFYTPLSPNTWQYLATPYLNANDKLEVRIISLSGGNISADVLKISAIVREREISLVDEVINLGEVVYNDTITYKLKIANTGISELNITEIESKKGYLLPQKNLPVSIKGMSYTEIYLQFLFNKLDNISDTLFIYSNDDAKPILPLPVNVSVQDYFKIVDNEDSLNYQEYGKWHTSVATAYKATSRYAWLNRDIKGTATFTATLRETGLYELAFIVPKTVNSSNNALYQLTVANTVIDSIRVNQNKGSGAWVRLGKYFLPKNIEVILKIIDTGESTEGSVIRADAIKYTLLESLNSIPEKNDGNIYSYKLEQNYPNPFNPVTTINYSIHNNSFVQLRVYDLLGQEIAVLVNKKQSTGNYSVKFNAENLPSGIYFYSLKAGDFSKVKKMLLLK
jgi:hypothetical protein